MDEANSVPDSAKPVEEEKVVILQPDTTLRKTIGPVNLDSVISETKLDKAKKNVQDKNEDFMQTLRIEFAKLEDVFAKLSTNTSEHEELLGQISFISLEIKGIAGLCGYSMIPQIARSLHEFTVKLTALDARKIKIIKVHIDTLRCIFDKGKELENSDVAKALAEEFKNLSKLP